MRRLRIVVVVQLLLCRMLFEGLLGAVCLADLCLLAVFPSTQLPSNSS